LGTVVVTHVRFEFTGTEHHVLGLVQPANGRTGIAVLAVLNLGDLLHAGDLDSSMRGDGFDGMDGTNRLGLSQGSHLPKLGHRWKV